ncbi:MAG: TonB-dependent receptor [Flavobacteriia bacterium]|nr:TonB-dependent receptor [Flavobacteriia bacterium]
MTLAEGFSLERGASVYQHRDTYGDLTFESYLNYDRTFGEDHSVKATAGTSVFTRQGKGLGAWAFNIPNNSWEYADISASQAAGGYLNGASSFFFEERLLSAFGRAEYAYKSRYLFSGVLRRDGSSKFGPNARWGVFPALSAAWILSDEPGYRWANTVDFAKLRASFGIAGNDQIPNFAYRALLNGEGVYPFNDLLTPGVAIGRASNPDLKWETTRQANLGLDLRVRNSVNVTLNAFEKRTSDLLFQPEVSGVLGTYSAGGYPPFINAGDVRNRGLELEMGYATKPTRTAQFTANFNPGDLRFVDLNGDGVINFSDNSDKTQIGSPIPDFTLGLNLTYRYKAFDVSANLYAALGQEIIRNYERQQPYANMLDYTIGRWTGNGSSNDIPRLTTSLTRNTVFSDYFVEKGDFLRVRNLQLGYTLGESLTERLGARKLRIYLSANNLFTLTGYQGYDPDIGNFGGVLAAGVDYGFYPQARTLMVGLSLQF